MTTTFSMSPIGTVVSSRARTEDDYWGGTRCVIELDEAYEASAIDGLESFSHVEVLFVFDRVDPASVVSGARHPRNNQDWPAVGIFAQRGKKRPNRIGSTICRVLGREGRRLEVAELDAVEGSPVLDLKPVIQEFLPRGEVRQPAWSSQLMQAYWLPESSKPAHDD